MQVKSRDSDSESEDDAQMRQFLEAADTTLLTNAMFQSQPKAEVREAANEEQPVTTKKNNAPPVKSERYVEDQDAPASDLQISLEMQTHIWKRLSGIIQEQIEFSLDAPNCVGKQKPPPDKVKLVSNADCYLIADLVEEGPPGPKKKPTIRRRTPKEEQCATEALNSVVVTGKSILEGRDLLAWAQKRTRHDKVFQYRASNPNATKLVAIEPTNEFTKRRRQNNWNESRISKKKSNKQNK
ncbi:uncharacterized protein LOC6550166 [Drosophila erecta]|uniref:Uncharacterized protein n=1 Tax=Drosophila erecta TaxID=7220 RepID=B3NWY4_DROER|nr:uncharacterized protein LOC6550166 [Drosophila erecta]EDV46531.1 uncharacterized protein Dere_GG18158 [Drosophila erecta]